MESGKQIKINSINKLFTVIGGKSRSKKIFHNPKRFRKKFKDVDKLNKLHL